MANKLNWEEAQNLLVKKVGEFDIQDAVYETAFEVVSRMADQIEKEYQIEGDAADGEEFYDDVRQECMDVVYDKMRAFLRPTKKKKNYRYYCNMLDEAHDYMVKLVSDAVKEGKEWPGAEFQCIIFEDCDISAETVEALGYDEEESMAGFVYDCEWHTVDELSTALLMKMYSELE